MQYMLLVYENSKEWLALPDPEKRQISDACWDWHKRLLQTGHARTALALHPVSTATTLRRDRGAITLIDGPFAETKEILGGFETVECKDLDEAIAIAKTFPGLKAGLAIEVRPLVPFEELKPPSSRLRRALPKPIG
jgi:hypothetical protein